MNQYDYETGMPVKRKRGRPRKQPDPHVFTASCANCARAECTRGLNARIRSQTTGYHCDDHQWGANHGA